MFSKKGLTSKGLNLQHSEHQKVIYKWYFLNITTTCSLKASQFVNVIEGSFNLWTNYPALKCTPCINQQTN